MDIKNRIEQSRGYNLPVEFLAANNTRDKARDFLMQNGFSKEYISVTRLDEVLTKFVNQCILMTS
jgi:hypothetical protein